MTRFQSSQIVRALEKAGEKGHTEAELRQLLLWPEDSVRYWLRFTLDMGEVAVAPGETDLPEPHYVTIGTWRDAQADGDLGR
ncbi:MAG: hypothetical protein WD825_17180 [Gemmatimonadaceae bacterium]